MGEYILEAALEQTRREEQERQARLEALQELTNVLYSAALRDVLVTLASFDVYAPRWTNLIHDEWIRNVVLKRPSTNRGRLEDTRRAMERAIPGALVENFEPLIETLRLPDPNDRHTRRHCSC